MVGDVVGDCVTGDRVGLMEGDFEGEERVSIAEESET